MMVRMRVVFYVGLGCGTVQSEDLVPLWIQIVVDHLCKTKLIRCLSPSHAIEHSARVGVPIMLLVTVLLRDRMRSRAFVF